MNRIRSSKEVSDFYSAPKLPGQKSSRQLTALCRTGSTPQIIVPPEEVASLTAFPSEALSLQKMPKKAALPVSVTRSFAKAIDAKVSVGQTNYVNDLMRNTAKKLPAIPTSRTSSHATSLQDVSQEDSFTRACAFPSERKTAAGRNSTLERFPSNIRPKYYAREIDERIMSDRNSFTNDLLRHVVGKTNTLVRPTQHRPRSVQHSGSAHLLTDLIDHDDSQLSVISSASSGSFMERYPETNFCRNTDSSNFDHSLTFDDASMSLAESEQEREMLEFALEMSVKDEHKCKEIDRMEREMIELAMQRSITDVGIQCFCAL
jgi:hypothetical protein